MIRSDECCLRELFGGGARPGSPAEAARFGEVVIVATPWGVTLDAVRGVADALAGKVLWDCTNPLKPDMMLTRPWTLVAKSGRR